MIWNFSYSLDISLSLSLYNVGLLSRSLDSMKKQESMLILLLVLISMDLNPTNYAGSAIRAGMYLYGCIYICIDLGITSVRIGIIRIR